LSNDLNLQSGVGASRLSHSGLGIAGFIVAVVGVVGMIVSLLLVFLVIHEHGYQWFQQSRQSPQIIGLGFIIILVGLLELVALGLSIAGICSNNKRKVFGILGIVFSAGIIALVGMFAIIGASAH